MSRAALVAAAVLVGFTPTACSKDAAPPKREATSRAEVVARLVDDVIVPGYESAASSAATFRRQVDALCASPSDVTLRDARLALVDAWSAWEATEAYDIGPAMSRRSTSAVSYRPDPGKIDAALAAGPPVDPEVIRNRTGSSLRGYGAAAHLLGSAASGASAFADAGRCRYLSAISVVVADEIATVSAAWTEGVDGERPFRSTATGEGDMAMTPTEVVDALVNIQLARLEAESKTLAPVADGDAEPSELPPYELFRIGPQVEAMAATSRTFGPLLPATLRRELSRRAKAVGTALGDASYLSDAPPDVPIVASTRDAVDGLRTKVRTEVVSRLDVTVGFSDNDGDS